MGFLLQDMDSMVRTTMTIEREIDDTRSIRDMSASAKIKENQSSSSSRKKQKTFSSHGSQGQLGPRPRLIIQGRETLQGS